MPRAGRRVGWGLLAAGVLGLAGPGAAQEPRYCLPPAPGHLERLGSADAPPPVLADEAQGDERRVEIAWLADPALFSYQLVARVSGSRLEVHGYVPNQATREKALAVARAHSRLQVADLLHVYPNLTRRFGGEPAPDKAVNRSVIVHTSSPELKHSAPLPAPTRQPYAPVAARMPAPPAPPPAAPAQPGARPSAPLAPQGVAQVAVSPAASPPPGGADNPGLSRVPPGTPLYLLPTPHASPPAEVVQADRYMPAELAEPPAPRPAVALPVSAGEPQAGTKAAYGSAGAPATTSGVRFVKHEEPAPRPREPGAGYVTTGCLLIADARPAPHAERTPDAREAPRPAKDGAGYVTTGTVLLTESRPAPAASAAGAGLTPQLQHLIQAACGPTARNVVVVAPAADALEVHFTAHTQAEADQLTAKIIVIPELLKYQLSFQVHLEP